VATALRLPRIGKLLLLLWPVAVSHAIDVPDFVPNVVDTTQTLSASEIDSLNQTIATLREQSQIWAAILVVGSTGNESIEQVADDVFARWELGKRDVDNGLLILVAKDDRKVRLEVGYGLEGSLTDANASRIIREIITPNFREAKFFDGLNTALLVSNDLVAGGSFPDDLSKSVEPGKSYALPVIIWFILIVVAPMTMRAVAVAKSMRYSDELQASPQESKWWRILFLSGVGTFLTLFLLINPGIFFVIFWHEMPFVAPVFILFAYLFLLAVNSGYLAMLSERRRAKFRSKRSSGSSDSMEAYNGGLGSGSRSGSSSSGSSSSSSSSGGGRSGGGGASGSW
jgi:uncharacterized protein